MNIYFGASISLNRAMLPVYQKIVAALKDQGHEVLSEYVVDPKLVPGDGLSAQELFERETHTIEQADAIIAEVSVPSWGTAFLIEHALEHGKPVLALFYKDTDHQLPLMIEGHPELYVQHYDEENIAVTLQKSLEHFREAKERKGKMIVVDGGDGSGKSTQTKLLLKYFEDHQLPHNFISFPRYKTSFHGHHVGRFLTGEFGGHAQVSPYLSSLAYALDRLTARHQMIEWLKSGHIVLADRYVSASMAHQGSKLSGKQQKEYLSWLYDMEYKEHKLPKEDIVIYLYVPVEISQKLLQQGDRHTDQADIDLEHQKKSIAMYQKLSKKFKHWHMVSCVDDKGQLMSIQAIHEKIIHILKENDILPD